MCDHIRVENRARLTGIDFDVLARELSSQTSMRRVVYWLEQHVPPLKIDDMVTQDEFSHDIVVGCEDGRFIVYESS